MLFEWGVSEVTGVVVPNCFEDGFDSVVGDLRALMVRKQRDYGHGNILKFGVRGCLVRASDKVERLANLDRRGSLPENEAVTDSWRDLANYAIIALMLERGVFELPLKEDVK